MHENIIVKPNEVWKYFFKREPTESTFLIAERPEYGIAIYLTESFNTYGIPSIKVESDDVVIYSEDIINEKDCERTVKEIYDKYLSDQVFSLLAESETEDLLEIGHPEIAEAIEGRETEISDCICDMLNVILDDGLDYLDSDESAELIEDIKDHICEYIYLKWGLEIYRPMIVEYEDGKEEFLKYPYSKLEFEDQDSPVYKL